jgi:hypothetical protein
MAQNVYCLYTLIECENIFNATEASRTLAQVPRQLDTGLPLLQATRWLV